VIDEPTQSTDVEAEVERMYERKGSARADP